MIRDIDLSTAINEYDLEAYLIDHGATEIKTSEWLLHCPQCGKDKLAVNSDRKVWHCWVCQDLSQSGKGSLIDLITLLDAMSWQDAINHIINQVQYKPVNYTLDTLRVPTPTTRGKLHPPEHHKSIDGTLPYMAKRGITVDDARAFGLVWCAAGRYANRLIFPVWEGGELVYYQGRAMWEESDRPGERYIKALNPPKEEGAMVSSDVLMNLDVARHYPRVAIVEGPIDCVKAGPSSVCSFGKKLSPTQISKLQLAGVRAVDLMWDGPSPTEPQGAWPEMQLIAPTLATLFDTRLVYLPSGDPGERAREEIDYWRARALPVVDAVRL